MFHFFVLEYISHRFSLSTILRVIARPLNKSTSLGIRKDLLFLPLLSSALLLGHNMYLESYALKRSSL